MHLGNNLGKTISATADVMTGRGNLKTISNVISPAQQKKEQTMPVFIVPALWIGGTALVLGGGYWIGHTAHWF